MSVIEDRIPTGTAGGHQVEKSRYGLGMGTSGDDKKGAAMAPILLKLFDLGWWRRRESNPRPPIVPASVYMLSRCSNFAPKDFQRQNSLGLAR